MTDFAATEAAIRQLHARYVDAVWRKDYVAFGDCFTTDAEWRIAGMVLHGRAEIVATLASKSIGPGTRANLDEFTYTTSDALVAVGGARRGKALAVINPAEPPMIMRNTIYCLTDDAPDVEKITESVLAMIGEVQTYVPGYKLVNGPVFDGKRVAVFMEVAGLGDYLPTYAGNLDIMTAAATRTAEMFAEEIIAGTLKLPAPQEALA